MATAAVSPAHVVVKDHPTTGLWSWLTTVDHKRIGILYLFTSLAMFGLGGLEAVIMRAQLMGPNGRLVSAETFNQLFTMHGTTMIFLVVMPVLLGFINYLVPLMIGARDMAFPRLNAMSFWLLLFGGIAAGFDLVIEQFVNQGIHTADEETGNRCNPADILACSIAVNARVPLRSSEVPALLNRVLR